MNYWENVCEMQKKQAEKGLKKYGQPLEENKEMTIIERLEYLQEELIDALVYIEHIKLMHRVIGAESEEELTEITEMIERNKNNE